MSVYDYCISLAKGINWTRNWRKSDRKLKAHSFVFHADEINAILKEPGVVKMRFYLGLEISDKNDDVLEKLVCVGVDDKDQDIIYSKKATGEDDPDTGIFDFSHPCPPVCRDKQSPLNEEPPTP